MTKEDIATTWVETLNAHETTCFLELFSEDAVLDDPSVGHRFEGRAGIGQYYRDYFIGYRTRTRLTATTPTPGGAHLKVHFTGDFPGGQTDGIFDLTLDGDLITHVHADLA
ncbi:nuclear transport factor 2 family protein [Kineosporia succinea]|uniref:Ketosteroid isomerase-like protein n=1 Tax=Kineosporia succinea TaxID=84632 RepID=A0ABT9PC39_9ACTN|nr:nuclear transport factor 2 family protein [Kineosporia succinea]MDP9829740.1 ketosteroid isomerase-like protein [Kineosporia succinea]